MDALPFLMISVRPEDDAADDEYAAMLRCTGLAESALRRVRVEQRPLGRVDLAQWSGIVLGGGPFQSSDDDATKSAVQHRVEADLSALLDDVVAADFPFLGACYGIGVLGTHEGALVDRTHGEAVGAVEVRLTPAGLVDPVLAAAPAVFGAFVGHKEAIRELPPHAVALATSDGAPVQAFRVGRNVYATQFHPELDIDGLVTRVRTYRDAGYFAPDELEAVIAAARASGVDSDPGILRRFAQVHARTPAAGAAAGPVA
jgi:GMP synthase (glutamine-hydrolysing)